MKTTLAASLLSGLCLLSTASLSAAADAASAAQDSPDADTLQGLSSLARAVEQAADLRAIKRLEHRYAQLRSAGQWRDAAELFAEQGALIAGEQRVNGREAIAAWLRARSGALEGQGLPEGHLHETFVLSNVLNLTEEPGQALGRWRQIVWDGEHGVSAHWSIGISENRYVEGEDGEWRFAELHHYPLYAGSYAEGWQMLKEEASRADVEPVPFHYTVDEAGIPAPSAPPVLYMDAPTQAEMEEQLAALEAQAARLGDEDAIISLQNTYGYYLDRMMWDDLADLFHEDGSLELGQAGIYQGKASIRRALEQFGPSPLPVGVVFDHVQLQPVVRVSADGSSAQARGVELRMLGEHEGESFIGSAVYVNDYRKADGVWMLDKVRVFDRVLSDYQQGWAQSALPAAQAPEEFPVDAPSSGDFPAYPAFSTPGLDLLTAAPTHAASPGAGGDVAQRLESLATQARQLDAYIGTENVANAYGYSIDEFLWDMMADLFSEDGWKELSYIGRYTGRERVRQSVVDRYGRDGRRPNSMTFHQKAQPVITVSEDGNSTRIRTRLFQINGASSPGGSWISGIYENGAVREDGVWKLSSMDLDYTWSANYLGGWSEVEARASSTGPATANSSLTGDAAPDAPLRGVVAPPYPSGPVDMAFHYDNPVSGREPPVRPAGPGAESSAD